MKSSQHKLVSSFLFFFFLLQPSLKAQDVSSSDSAGAEQERIRQQEIYQKQEQAVLKEEKPSPLPEEKEVIPELDPGVSFRMNDIRITGNEKISEDELRPLASQLLNRDVNMNEVQAVISQIKKLYRSRGYIAVYVYVPRQKVKEGVIEIRIVEGKLGNLDISDNKWYSDKIIEKKLQIEPGQIVEYKKLSAGIARLNEHPDIKAKAVLKPGKVEGTTDVELKVKDRLPVHLSADVNNLGTDNTGKTRAGIALRHNNVTGITDQASSRFQIGSGVWAVGADYNLPVNDRDTRVGFAYQHSSVDVEGSLKPLGIEGRADTYSPYIQHPVTFNERLRAKLMAGFDFKEVKNTVRGTEAGRDSLRILNTGFDINQVDRYGRTYFMNVFHTGFSSFLGASSKTESHATRPGTGGQFFIYRQTLFRYFQVYKGTALLLRTNMQLANHALPPSEQFRLGGAFSVRGYSEGEYLADYGAAGTIELHVPTYFFPKDWKLPYSKMSLRDQIKSMAFFDLGGGHSRLVRSGENERRTLAGIGLGLRIHLFDRVYARLEWARPIGEHPNDHARNSFHYGISAEMF